MSQVNAVGIFSLAHDTASTAPRMAAMASRVSRSTRKFPARFRRSTPLESNCLRCGGRILVGDAESVPELDSDHLQRKCGKSACRVCASVRPAQCFRQSPLSLGPVNCPKPHTAQHDPEQPISDDISDRGPILVLRTDRWCDRSDLLSECRSSKHVATLGEVASTAKMSPIIQTRYSSTSQSYLGHQPVNRITLVTLAGLPGKLSGPSL